MCTAASLLSTRSSNQAASSSRIAAAVAEHSGRPVAAVNSLVPQCSVQQPSALHWPAIVVAPFHAGTLSASAKPSGKILVHSAEELPKKVDCVRRAYSAISSVESESAMPTAKPESSADTVIVSDSCERTWSASCVLGSTVK